MKKSLTQKLFEVETWLRENYPDHEMWQQYLKHYMKLIKEVGKNVKQFKKIKESL